MVNLPGKVAQLRQSRDQTAQRADQRQVFPGEQGGVSAGSPGTAMPTGTLSRSCPQGITAMAWTATFAKLMPWIGGLLCLAEIGGHVVASSPIHAIAFACVVLIGCDCILMILAIIWTQIAADPQERSGRQAKLYRQNVGPLLICALIAGTDLILRFHQTSNAFVVTGTSFVLAGIAMTAARVARDHPEDKDHRPTRPPIGVY